MTPFQGKRLTQLRTMAGVTQKELATLVGKTAQAISTYENGKSQPSDALVDQLASIFGVSHRLFFQPVPANQEGARAFFRSNSAATKKARDIALVKAAWISELADLAIECPSITSNLPQPLKYANVGKIEDLEIREAACQLRQAWGVGNSPINNLTALCENNGVIVQYLDLGSRSLDALSYIRQNAAPILIVNRAIKSTCRQRFGLAHELGHLVLHANFETHAQDGTNTWKLMERQAHRFASFFLLPESSILTRKEKEAPVWQELIEAKSYWRISIAAIIKRLRDDEKITETEYKSLYVGLSKRGWRENEPLDDAIDNERDDQESLITSLAMSHLELLPEKFRREINPTHAATTYSNYDEDRSETKESVIPSNGFSYHASCTYDAAVSLT